MDHSDEQFKCRKITISKKSMLSVASLIILMVLPVGIVHASPTKVGVVGAANPDVASLGKDNVKQTLVLGKDVFFDQTIVTDGKGSLQLLFLDKSALTVGPNSSLKIDKFVYNPQDSSGEMTITSTKGAFRFIGGALSKKNAVKIKTPVSTIGIRGGIAMVDVSPESGATNATFVYGKDMVVENKAGDRQVTTQAGSAMSVLTPTSPPTPPVKVDMQMLAANIKQLESSDGQHGGTTTIPDEKTVSDKINSSEEKTAPSAAEPGAESSSGESKKESESASSDKESTSSDSESKSQESDSKNSQSSSDGSASNDSNSNDSGKTKKDDSASNDSGSAKKDGDPINNKDSGEKQPVKERGAAPEPKAGAKPPVPVAPKGASTSNTVKEPVVMNSGGIKITMPPSIGSVMDTANRTAVDNSVAATNPRRVQKPPVITEIKPSGPINPPPPTVVTTITTKTATTEETRSLPPSPVPGPTATTFTHKGRYAIKTGTLANNKSGLAEAYVESGKFDTALTQASPSASTGEADVNKTIGSGYHNSVTGVVNGEDYMGHSYLSANERMHYYQMVQVTDSTEQIAMVIGTRVDRASFPATGTDFYDFLPELQQHHVGGSTQMGFFNWNIVDTQLLPSGVPAIPTDMMGMVVHWDSGTFFSGYMNWDYTSITDYKHMMKVAFGKVNRTGAAPELSGRSLDIYGANGTPTSLTKRHVGVIQNVYGSAGNVDGFLLEGLTPDNPVPLGTDITAATTGTRTQQPMMKGNAPADISTIITKRNPGVLKGFMAGFIIKDAQNSLTYERYWNAGPEDLVINKTSSTIGANFKLLNTQTSTDIYGKFGSSATSGNPHQVFVADKIYAIEQGNFKYGTTEVARVDGVMVGNYISTNASMKCDTCQFVDWGVWAAEIQPNSATPAVVDIAHMMPYVAGTITENIGDALTGDATYSGKVIGNILNDTANVLTHQVGEFDANVNFNGGAPKLTSFTANFAGRNFGFTGGTHLINNGAGEAATFNNLSIYNTDGGSSLTGQINGAFFGPNAEDIGGNFKYNTDSGNTKAIGVFLGSQP